MLDKNTIYKKITDIIFVILGSFLSQFISNNFFNDSFWLTLIILIVFLLIMTPVKIYIDSKIDRYFIDKEK